MAPFTLYRRLLSRPSVASVLASTTIGGLPAGMLPLGLVLLGAEKTGSYAAAGAITGGLVIANAATVPFRSRVVDRRGATTLTLMAAVRSAALVLLVLAASAGAAVGLLISLAALAGLATPPLTPALRALWRQLVPDEDERSTAFAVQAVLTELLFIGGPLVTAGLAISIEPSGAVHVAAALGLGGTVWLVALPAVRSGLGGEPRAPTRWGAMASPGVRALFAVSLFQGAVLGVYDLGFPAFSAEHGSSAAGGLALAALGVGSAVAGVAYGARTWVQLASQLLLAASLLMALFAGAPLLADSTIMLIVTAVVAGLAIAPANAIIYELLDEVTPGGTATEALGWLVAALAAGGAAGTFIAGVVAEGRSPSWSLALAPTAAAGALLTLALCRNALEASPARAHDELVDVGA